MYHCRMKAYEGNLPFLFISYSHKDSDLVLPILDELADRGYRIWYDDGITAGSEWPEYIATHLAGSGLVLAFISPNSADSANCRREITFALSQNKPFAGIYLKETQLSPGMEMQLSAQQCLMKYGTSDESFYQKLSAIPEMASCRRSAAASGKASSSDTASAEHKTNAAVQKSKAGKRQKRRNQLPDLIIAAVLIISMLIAIFVIVPKLNTGSQSKSELRVLGEGWYSVLDKDDETAAYLYSTGKKLTVYDENGEELMKEARFVWDEEEKAFLIDDTIAFTLESDDSITTFTVPKGSPVGINRGKYTLNETDERNGSLPEAAVKAHVVDSQGSSSSVEPVTGGSMAYLTYTDGTVVSVTIPDSYSIDNWNYSETNETGNDILYTMQDLPDTAGDGTSLTVYIGMSSSRSYTSNDLCELAIDSIQDEYFGTDAMLNYTEPEALTCNGTEYQYCFYETLIGGMYRTKLVLCSDDGVHFIKIDLMYNTYTESLYENSHVLLESFLNNIIVS